jgi:hypothetical protein
MVARCTARVMTACAGLAICPSGAAGADRSARWLAAIDGLWSDAANWSGGVVPNNGVGDVFDVTIDATGAPHRVDIDLDVALRDLTIDSADALVALGSQRSLDIGGVVDLRAGRLRLQGGALRGGTLRMSGGALTLWSTISSYLDGVRIEGEDFTIGVEGPSSFMSLRITNGLELSGQAMDVGATRTVFVGENSFRGGTLHTTTTTSLDNDATLTIEPDAVFEVYGLEGGDGSRVVNRGMVRLGAAQHGSIWTQEFINEGAIELAPGVQSFDIRMASWRNDGDIAFDDGVSGVLRGDGVNHASISAGDGGALEIRGSWANTGDIVVGTGSTLLLSGAWTNTGRIEVGPGSTLQTDGVWSAPTSIVARDGTVRLGGALTAANLSMVDAAGSTIFVEGTIENDGQTLDLSALGAMGDTRLTGRVRGGSANIATLEAYGQAPTLDGVAVTGGDLRIGAGRDNRIRVGSGGFTTPDGHAVFVGNGQLIAVDDAILSGLTLSQETAANQSTARLSVDAGRTLTLGATTRLSAHEFSFGGSGTIVNEGLMEFGSDAPADELSIGVATFVNDGTIEMHGEFARTNHSTELRNRGLIRLHHGARLDLYGKFANEGTIEVAGGSLTIRRDFATDDLGLIEGDAGEVVINARWDNHGRLIDADRIGANWRFMNGWITGGEIAGGVTLSGNAHLDDMTLVGDELTLTGPGTWGIGSNFVVGDATLRISEGGASISQGTDLSRATIVLDETYLAGSLTLGAAGTIRAVGWSRINGPLINEGLIAVGDATRIGNLEIVALENRGDIHIGENSVARLQTATNLGDIVLDDGATLIVTQLRSVPFANFGRIALGDSVIELRTDRDQGSISAASLGQIAGVDGVIRVVDLLDNNGNTLRPRADGPEWQVTHVAGGEIVLDQGRNLVPAGPGFTLEDVVVRGGELLLDNASLGVEGDVRVEDAAIRLRNGAGYGVQPQATLAAPLVIVEPDAAGRWNEIFYHQGRVNAQTVIRGAGLRFRGAGVDGVIHADRLGVIELLGEIDIGDTAAFVAENGATLDARGAAFVGGDTSVLPGGFWRAGTGGIIYAVAASVITDSYAAITLDGADARIQGARNISRNYGSLTLVNGATLLMRPVALAPSAAAAKNDGALMTNRRRFEPVNAVPADFHNFGSVTLGVGSGVMSLATVRLFDTSTLEVFVSDAGHGRLEVDGRLLVNGHLTILLDGSIVPAYDSSWTIALADEIVGQFDQVDLPSIGGRQNWSVEVLPSAIAIRFVPAPGGLVAAVVVAPLTLLRRRAVG